MNQNKNVSLVYPCLRATGGFNSLGKNVENCYIQHALPQLAICLEQKDYAVRLLDLRDVSSWREAANWIRKDPAEIYGITMLTLDYHEVVKTARLIKKIKPNAKVIVGGPHPSVMPNETAKESCFDYVIVGEGEISFPYLVEKLNECCSGPKVIYGEHPNLNELPYEKREIFNLKKIFASKRLDYQQPIVNVISGRGCIYGCRFCQPAEQKIFGKFRMRSLDHFFGEIGMLNKKYNFNTLIIDDDSFTLKPDYTLAFCDRYEEIKKPFVVQSRADFIVKNEDVIKRLAEVGCTRCHVGFEVGYQRGLDFLNKGTTIEQNIESARILHKYGIKIFANVMLGIPTETREEAMQTFEMVKKIDPETPSWAFFTPVPGSYLFDYCRDNNLLLDDDPALLGRRNPSEPKIKGVDYVFLSKMLGIKKRPLWRRVARKVINKVKK